MSGDPAQELTDRARQHARDVFAEQVGMDTGLWAKNADAIGLGIEAGIAGAVMALRDAGLLPSSGSQP